MSGIRFSRWVIESGEWAMFLRVAAACALNGERPSSNHPGRIRLRRSRLLPNTLLLPSARPPLLRAEEQDKLCRADTIQFSARPGKIRPHSASFGVRRKPTSSTVSIPAPGVPMFSRACRITPSAASPNRCRGNGSRRICQLSRPSPHYTGLSPDAYATRSGQPIFDFEPADALELIGVGGGGAYSMNPGALLALSIRGPSVPEDNQCDFARGRLKSISLATS